MLRVDQRNIDDVRPAAFERRVIVAERLSHRPVGTLPIGGAAAAGDIDRFQMIDLLQGGENAALEEIRAPEDEQPHIKLRQDRRLRASMFTWP